MIKLQTLRNKTIDSVVNVLNSAKYTPDKHDVALNAIINDSSLTDEQKITAMRKYFTQAALEIGKDKLQAEANA